MYLAIDIGGTKTLLATFSNEGKLLESIKIETPNWYPTFLEEVARAYGQLKDVEKLRACVVGAPGKVDRKHHTVVAFGNLPWENVHLKADFERFIPVPVTIENDANLAGLSEASLIKHGYNKVLYITISTGIGGIVIKDGKITEDYADTEFGSMVFEHDGKIQKWEEFASGRAIFEKYGLKASEIDNPGTWYAISRNIALGLNHVIANLTPDVIVFGGGVGAHFHKFADPLHEELMLFGTKLVSIPPLREAIRAEEAVIYGCYELARQNA